MNTSVQPPSRARSSPKVSFYTFSVPVTSPRQPLVWIPFYCLVLPVLEFHMDGIIQYVLFCVCLFYLTRWFWELSKLSDLSVVCPFLLLNSILLYGYTSHTVDPLLIHICVSTIWGYSEQNCYKIHVKFSLWTHAFISLH